MDKEPEDFVFEQASSTKDAIKLIDRIFDVAKPGAVFSEPVTSGEYTVVTAAELAVTMGAGYGGGGMHSPAEAEDEESQTTYDGGGGGGGGGFATARPVAVITIGPNGTDVQPIVDPTKISIAFFTTLSAMVITLVRVFRFSRSKK